MSTALSGEPRELVRKEAIQVAVMALRVVLDGDVTFDGVRERRALDPLVD